MGGKGILAVFVISILSPLTRGDQTNISRAKARSDFNPLPSHEGRRAISSTGSASQTFQSTPLTRGETATRCSRASALSNFNPLPSHEGRRKHAVKCHRQSRISIHSPHARGDACPRAPTDRRASFQSTPLMRGETAQNRGQAHAPGISIHSPHTRGDGEVVDMIKDLAISIHSPHTKGDGDAAAIRPRKRISIHSPHVRGDTRRERSVKRWKNFNPLPSHEGRPAHAAPAAKHEEISIHSPHTRGDSDSYTIHSDHVLFQSTLLIRRETPVCKTGKGTTLFQSTPLIRGETLVWDKLTSRPQFQSTPLMRGETGYQRDVNIVIKFQSTPLIRGETRAILRVSQLAAISIRSPLTRGDSISLQKSIRIYVSLHNKTMIHRFSELYKPLFLRHRARYSGAKPTEKP